MTIWVDEVENSRRRVCLACKESSNQDTIKQRFFLFFVFERERVWSGLDLK